MSDKIVVMKDGEIQQVGTPTDIYNERRTAMLQISSEKAILYRVSCWMIIR